MRNNAVTNPPPPRQKHKKTESLMFKWHKKLNKQIMKLLMRIIIYRYVMHIPYTCTYYFNACQINGIHDKLWINSNGNSILQNMIYFRETWLVIHVIHMYYNIQSSSLSGEFLLDPSLNCQADLCKIRKLLEKNYIRRFQLKIPISAEFYRIACMSTLLNIVL